MCNPHHTPVTGDPSLTALYRNVATAKGFTSTVLTEMFMYMEESKPAYMDWRVCGEAIASYI